MSRRMPGRVHGAKQDPWLALQFDHFIIDDETINSYQLTQRFSGEFVCGNLNVVAQMLAQGVYSAYVVRVQVSQNDLANLTSFLNQLIDTPG